MTDMNIQTQGKHLHHKCISVPLHRRNSFTVDGHSLPLLSAYSSKSFQVLWEQWLKEDLSICNALRLQDRPSCTNSFCIIHCAILNTNQWIAISYGVKTDEKRLALVGYTRDIHLILTLDYFSYEPRHMISNKSQLISVTVIIL